MRARTPAPVLSVLTALFVLSASGPTAAAEPDEAAIRNVVARFVEAWNQHDAHAFSLVFSMTKQADQWSILVMHNVDLPVNPPPPK